MSDTPDPKKAKGAEPEAAAAEAAPAAAAAARPAPAVDPKAEEEAAARTAAYYAKKEADKAFTQEVWYRGLWMLVLLILFQIGQTVLIACTIIQFLWMLFAKEKNAFVAEFGASLSEWLRKTARFNAGASDEKPFPWTRWGA